MILPTKHSGYNRALLVIGAEIIRILTEPKTVSRIWDEIKRDECNGLSYLTYDWFVLSLDFLYILKIIELDKGLIRKSHNDS